MAHGKIAAFFDFDKTLLAGDSAKIGIKYLYERGDVGLPFIAGILARNFFYKRNLYPPEGMSRFALTLYRGRDITEYVAGSASYYDEMLKPLLAPRVLARLRDHQRQGHETALCTASLRYMLEPVVKDLAIDHLLCTDLERRPDGRTTGRAVGPICVAEHKVTYAKRLADERGYDLAASWAYSDHHSDIPLLELVGNPVAVEPTKPLRRHAGARGWEIIGFR